MGTMLQGGGGWPKAQPPSSPPLTPQDADAFRAPCPDLFLNLHSHQLCFPHPHFPFTSRSEGPHWVKIYPYSLLPESCTLPVGGWSGNWLATDGSAAHCKGKQKHGHPFPKTSDSDVREPKSQFWLCSFPSSHINQLSGFLGRPPPLSLKEEGN